MQMRKDSRLIMELERSEQYIQKKVDTHISINEKKKRMLELGIRELQLVEKL